MGRPGRYTLSVMVWVAAYAGWSSVLGIVAATITGHRLQTGDAVGSTVSPALSTLFSVLVPLVPTLTALWFNDWARDGFPTRDERRRAATVAARSRAAEPVAAELVTEPPVTEPPVEPEAGYPVAPLLRDEPAR